MPYFLEGSHKNVRSFLSDITKMICAEQISVTFRCLLKPAFTINVSNTERMEAYGKGNGTANGTVCWFSFYVVGKWANV